MGGKFYNKLGQAKEKFNRIYKLPVRGDMRTNCESEHLSKINLLNRLNCNLKLLIYSICVLLLLSCIAIAENMEKTAELTVFPDTGGPWTEEYEFGENVMIPFRIEGTFFGPYLYPVGQSNVFYVELELDGPLGSPNYNYREYHKTYKANSKSFTEYYTGRIDKRDKFNIFLDTSEFEEGNYRAIVRVYASVYNSVTGMSGYESGGVPDPESVLDSYQWSFTIRDSVNTDESEYERTNEYLNPETASKASCAPNTARAVCSSPNSCVSCGGTCYSEGLHNFGSDAMICAKGKWLSINPESEPTEEYERTNEYLNSETASKASCAPNTARAVCSSPNSCVSCGGTCYSEGLHNFGSDAMICAKGKWLSINPESEPTEEYERTNEYSDTSLAACTPGSLQGYCSSPDSCLGCNGQCYPPGPISSSIACVNGKFTRTSDSGSTKPKQPAECPPECGINMFTLECGCPGYRTDCLAYGCSYRDRPDPYYGQCICPWHSGEVEPNADEDSGWSCPTCDSDSEEQDTDTSEDSAWNCPPTCNIDSNGYCICGPARDEQDESEECPSYCAVSIMTGECICPS
jgi:hypothetical protein